ncbi:MAG: hypothetical protein HY238_12085 [Acidobacteria bacterium]|nr:hypothetical protein [Acidobacteriota bacterium]
MRAAPRPAPAPPGLSLTGRSSCRGIVNDLPEVFHEICAGFAVFARCLGAAGAPDAGLHRGAPQRDYQVPVRIGSVTVPPGDILLGERHGILVIPAVLAGKIANIARAEVSLRPLRALRLCVRFWLTATRAGWSRFPCPGKARRPHSACR